jgi:hypothetical protein
LLLPLGGAVWGSLLGILLGAVVGVVYGALVGDISLGLDGAVLGCFALAVVGGLYGLALALGGRRRRQTSDGARRPDWEDSSPGLVTNVRL